VRKKNITKTIRGVEESERLREIGLQKIRELLELAGNERRGEALLR